MAIKTFTDLLLCVYRCHFATIKLFFLYLGECNIATHIRNVGIPVAMMQEDDGGAIAESHGQWQVIFRAFRLEVEDAKQLCLAHNRKAFHLFFQVGINDGEVEHPSIR